MRLSCLMLLFPGVRRSRAQVIAYEQAWDAANAAALRRDGPLWVVLGDSSGQGVGAARYDAGYVGPVRAALDRRDGTVWRVLNLARSGARTAQVVDEQLPRWAAIGAVPDLVTVVVGGNDASHTPLPVWLEDIRRLVAAVPANTVVGTVPRGWRESKARRANEELRTRAQARGLPVADLWSTTGPPYAGKYADGFHPNDRGYAGWAAALIAALPPPRAAGRLD